jgi:hypothetical protein
MAERAVDACVYRFADLFAGLVAFEAGFAWSAYVREGMVEHVLARVYRIADLFTGLVAFEARLA